MFFNTEIELDDKVINVVNDEWRNVLYDLYTPEEIAEHIVYNMVVNHANLSQLDGWADQSNDNAKLGHIHWETESVDEIK
jgi:hypothetical protein